MTDLRDLAAKTGIDEMYFIHALTRSRPAKSTCLASTIEEARKIYEESKPFSEECFMAFWRWNELCHEAILRVLVYGWKKNHCIDELKGLVEKCPPGTSSKKELNKWLNEISMEEVKKAVTVAEVITAYDRTPESGWSRSKALDKWLSLCREPAEFKHFLESQINMGTFAETEVLIAMINVIGSGQYYPVSLSGLCDRPIRGVKID